MTQPDDAEKRAGTILQARNGAVMRHDETGIVLRLSDRVIADIAARLPAPASGGGAEARADAGALDAALLGDIDAWNLRQAGEWLLFTAHLPGADVPRQYRRLAADGPHAATIADAPGPVLGLLALGGARAALAWPRPAAFAYHILAPGDDIGAVGMAGTGPSAAADLMAPLSEVTRDAILAEVLLGGRRALRRALPLFLVRAETDGAASALALGQGPAFANLVQAARNLAAIARRLEKPARILAVRLDYSLEDVSGDAAAYAAGMRALMAQLSGRLATLGFRKPLFIATFECGTARLSDGPVLRGQWELAWNPAGHDLVFTAPGYMFAQDAYGRMTEAAMVQSAEMEAEALGVVHADAPWFCPTFLLAEQEGLAQIRVKARAMGALVLDPADPFQAGAGAGFRLAGAENGARIIGVALAADDPQDVILTCDRRPEGAALEVLYAFGAPPREGPLPAACGALRDGWAKPSATGALLHRWALPCALPVH